MAKKRQHDDSEETLTSVTQEMPTPTPTEPPLTDSTTPLMDEIQTFIAMRDELAEKLAAEIEATERRLEELKCTAASLFPQSVKAMDDKKAKKPKPKVVKEDKGSDSGTEA